MKGILVLNACTGDYWEQGRLLAGFLTEHVKGIELDTAIVFHTKEADRADLLRVVPVRYALLVCLEKERTETMLNALAALAARGMAEVYLFAGNYSGSELAVRLGHRRGGTFLTSVDSVRYAEGQMIAQKAVYGGYMEAEFVLKRAPYCLSISKSCTEFASKTGEPAALLETLIVPEDSENDFSADFTFVADEQEKSLETAPFVLAVGRGAKNHEGVEYAAEAAKRMGAELGVSRPVAMSSWAPMSRLVGVSGAMIKPEVCIAAAVSGAPAFYAGIEKSGFIVSINSDPSAPIHRKADVAIADDWQLILKYVCEEFKTDSAQKRKINL
ncbi:MAG: Electron transfer flavoprotein alpha subunit apoprotein [Eubacteriales bacterium]|jgi:electron transfer flavoprotein alpha subunit